MPTPTHICEPRAYELVTTSDRKSRIGEIHARTGSDARVCSRLGRSCGRSGEGQEGQHGQGAPPAKPIVKASYGKVDGKEVDLYTLTNKNGPVAKVTNYGAIITELHVPDKAGKLGDIVLGYDNVDDYVKKSPYFGATVGRVANRIKNAKFELEGKTYKLAANNAPHHLHGGKKGWDKVIWKAEAQGDRRRPVAQAHATCRRTARRAIPAR